MSDPEAVRRVQVYDGEGECTLDVLVTSQVEADWLRDFLEGQDVGDVYVDPAPAGRLHATATSSTAALRSQ